MAGCGKGEILHKEKFIYALFIWKSYSAWCYTELHSRFPPVSAGEILELHPAPFCTSGAQVLGSSLMLFSHHYQGSGSWGSNRDTRNQHPYEMPVLPALNWPATPQHWPWEREAHCWWKCKLVLPLRKTSLRFKNWKLKFYAIQQFHYVHIHKSNEVV